METVTHTYISITTADACRGCEVWIDGGRKQRGVTGLSRFVSVLAFFLSFLAARTRYTDIDIRL